MENTPTTSAARKVAGLQQRGGVPKEGSPSEASGRSSLHLPLLVHWWRRRITLVKKLRENWAASFFLPLLPPPPQSPADCRYFYFVACFTSVEPIEFSARKGVSPVASNAELLREGSLGSSICLSTQRAVQGQQETESSARPAVLSLPPLQPLDSF